MARQQVEATLNLCVQSLDTCWVHLLPICHSVILRVLVCQSGVWGSSPLYVKNQPMSRFVKNGAIIQGLVVESRKPTTWLYTVVSVSKGMPSPLSDIAVCGIVGK